MPARSPTMSSLLSALPILALVAAALESLLVRVDLSHRPVGAALFGQAFLLWLVLGVLASLPAAATLFVRRRVHRADEARPLSARAVWPVLAGWMAAPVLAHGALDRHTALAGDLAGLAAPRPWLEVAGLLAGLVVALAVL
ncbi:MAG: hypothetical protein AB1726_08520, partial [Planctomycetota bacterium]